eukprot:m.199889 g.199889  ORF g.199889 m.199889 type:complete len:857 (-) comp21905_c1_seq5:29-2599(-)
MSRPPPDYNAAPKFSESRLGTLQDNADEEDDFTDSFVENQGLQALPGGMRQIDTPQVSLKDSDGRPKRVTMAANSDRWRNLLDQLPSHKPEATAILEASHAVGRTINAEILDSLLEELQEEEQGAAAVEGRNIGRTLTRHHQRSAQLSRRFTRKSLHKKASKLSLGSVGVDEVTQEAIEESEYILKNIRNHPHRMTVKLDMRREEVAQLEQVRKNLSGFQMWYAETTHMWHLRWLLLKESIRDIGLWDHSIKRLEGKHGAHVGTFFTFLRWCLGLNLIIALLYVFFVIVPYAAEHRFDSSGSDMVPKPEAASNAFGENLLGLFTGGAKLNRTAYFIGTYFLTYDSPNIATPHTNYDLPLAYLLVCGFSLGISFLLLFKSVHSSVYSNAQVAEEGQHPISEIVFSLYDHSLTDPASISIKRGAAVRLLREILDEEKLRAEHEQKNFRNLILKRIVINIVIFAMLGLALWSVQAAVVRYAESTDTAFRLVPAIVLTVYNLVLPIAFELLAVQEEWRTPLFVIQLSVVRAVLLRLVGLFVFFYTVVNRRDNFMCSESYVGQQAYNLFVVVFIVELFTTVFSIPCKRYLVEHYKQAAFLGPAKFQIIKNTLELIYSQCIVWFGAFFCPMMPVLAIFKIILLFYVKEFITVRYCVPPPRAFKARHSFRGLFYFVMLVALLCVAAPLGYIITALPPSGAFMDSTYQERFITNADLPSATACSTNTVACSDCFVSPRVDDEYVCFKTSTSGFFPNGANVTLGEFCAVCPSGCGPFRNQLTIYDTMSNEFNTWPYFLRVIIEFIGTLSFALLVIFFMGTWLLFYRATAAARNKLINKLKVERDMERIDKIWILQKYSITLDNAQ